MELFEFVGKKILENEVIPDIFNDNETVSLESNNENRNSTNSCC